MKTKRVFLIVGMLLYALVKSNAECESMCILVAIPLPSENANNCNRFLCSRDVSTVLANSSQDNLQLIVVDSTSEYSTLIHFLFQVVFRKYIQCCRIGVVGDIDSNSASIIHTLANRWNQSTTQVASVMASNLLPFTSSGTSRVVDMNPLSHYIEGLVQFMDNLNWTRVGLISDETQYHQYVSVQIEQGIQFSPGKTVVRMGQYDSSLHTLLQVKRYGTDVVIISADEITACSILDNASKLNLRWPSYAWIMLTNKYTCDNNMEGVIFLNDVSISENRYPQPLADFEAIYESVNTSFTGNEIFYKHSYASILYDSILTAALADHINLSNTTFPGATGQVRISNGKRLSNISIVQVQDGNTVEIGYYDTESKQIIYSNPFTSGNIPRGTIMEVYDTSSVVHITLVMCVFVLCFIFVTVVLVLFIYFRNEPEIKASSASLSMCMFLGCYLLLLFVPLLLIQSVESLPVSANTVCMTLPVFFGTGLPFPLILATLIVKMLRVYTIFSTIPFHTRKSSFLMGLFFSTFCS